VAEAVATLAAAPDESKVLAGGQSLIPLMNFRLVQPQVLVDINYIPGLADIRLDEHRVTIGALARTRTLELSSAVAERFPLLIAATRWVGHVQIRNRGTVGGTIAHADPAAEIPAICLLMGAEMRIVSPEGSRVVPANDFFLGFLTTALRADELLVEVAMPMPSAGTGWGFVEYAQRRGDFALAGAACLAGNEATGGQVRVVAFGPGRRAMRCGAAEGVFKDGEITNALIRDAAAAAVDEVREEASEDPESAYRYGLIGTMVTRALEQAAGSARARS
jgi:carbon-monoxide dehydrogenase medium subunit